MLHEYDRVGTGECKTETANMSSQQQAVDTWISIEGLNDRVPLARLSSSVEAHIRDGRHMRLEQIGLNDIQHLLHLTKDEDTMVGKGRTGFGYSIDEFALPLVGKPGTGSATSNPTVGKKLAATWINIRYGKEDDWDLP